MMSHTIGAMTQRLEHEMATVVAGTITMSAQNQRTAIDHLCTELQEKFDKDRAELQQEQLNTQGRMNEIYASIERLTQQLNSFKLVNERNLGALKEKLLQM